MNVAPGASDMSTLGYIQNWEFWVGTNVCGSACGGVTFLVLYNRSLVLANGSLLVLPNSHFSSTLQVSPYPTTIGLMLIVRETDLISLPWRIGGQSHTWQNLVLTVAPLSCGGGSSTFRCARKNARICKRDNTFVQSGHYGGGR